MSWFNNYSFFLHSKVADDKTDRNENKNNNNK